MFAASALSGWLRLTTSSAAADRPEISNAVTAPNAMTSTASAAPMIWSLPGSVVAAVLSRAVDSDQALRRGAGTGTGTGAGGWADACSGAVRTFGGYVT
jgi:hypothetical protein